MPTKIEMTLPAIQRLLMVLIVATVVLLAHQPGYVSYDAIVQWFDGRYGFTSGFPGHPPLMSLVWAGLEYLLPGPILMFGLQWALFTAAVATVLVPQQRRPWIAAMVAVTLFLQPYLFANLARINKDVLGGSAVLLAFAMVLPRPSPARLGWQFWVAGALVAFGLFIRYQFISALPFLLWIIYRTRGLPAAARGTGGFALGCVAVLAAIQFGGKGPSDVDASLRKIMMYDLAGIVIRAPAERLPDLPATTAERDTMLQTMRALYTTAKVDPFFDVPVELAPIGRAPLPVLSQVWRRVVVDHGGPFLAHRFATFGRVVGLGDMRDCAVVSRQPTAPDPPELAVVLNTAALPQPYSQGVFYWRAFPIASPLFRPITYVLIAVVAGAATVAWQPSNPVTVWVRWSIAAGLAYLSTFLALPQACDGRYSFLPIALILLATTVLALAAADVVLGRRRLTLDRRMA